MTRRSIFWRAGAALFVIINAGGAILAAAMGEQLHTAGHVVLLILGLGAYTVWRGVPRGEDPRDAQLADERLDYLQQSVDAIALEVERIGEAQRFSDKLRAGREATLPHNKEQ